MAQSSSLYFPFVALSKACRELHFWFVYWNNLTPPAAQKRAVLNTSRLAMLLWDLACLIYSSIKTINFELFMSNASSHIFVILKQTMYLGSPSKQCVHTLWLHISYCTWCILGMFCVCVVLHTLSDSCIVLTILKATETTFTF